MVVPRLSRRVITASAAGAAGLLLAALPASAQAAASDDSGHSTGRLAVLLDHLSSPKGVTVAPTGDPVVAQGAFTPAAGPVLLYLLHGRDRGSTVPLSDARRFGDVAAAPDGSGWALGAGSVEEGGVGDTWLYRRDRHGKITKVVDIAAYQKTDPDPYDHDDPPNPTESNPYGLAALKNGDALVTDAANNDLLRVTPKGKVTTVARFGLENVSTDQVPPGALPPGTPPLPPTLPAEAVPTTVTIGPDGYAYVGELKGFPFHTGTSRIWRVNPWTKNALCSVSGSTKGCRTYAKDYTAIEDIAFDRRSGALYVYELAKAGVFAYEAGLQPGGTFPSAVLLKVRHGKRSELVPGQLSQPGGVAVNRHGQVFVTDQVFTGGRLSEVRGCAGRARREWLGAHSEDAQLMVAHSIRKPRAAPRPARARGRPLGGHGTALGCQRSAGARGFCRGRSGCRLAEVARRGRLHAPGRDPQPGGDRGVRHPGHDEREQILLAGREDVLQRASRGLRQQFEHVGVDVGTTGGDSLERQGGGAATVVNFSLTA